MDIIMIWLHLNLNIMNCIECSINVIPALLYWNEPYLLISSFEHGHLLVICKQPMISFFIFNVNFIVCSCKVVIFTFLAWMIDFENPYRNGSLSQFVIFYPTKIFIPRTVMLSNMGNWVIHINITSILIPYIFTL